MALMIFNPQGKLTAHFLLSDARTYAWAVASQRLFMASIQCIRCM